MAAVVAVVLIVGGLLACGVITGLKGKFGFLAGGFVIHLLWIVGAVRLGKPGSLWARRFYDETKQAQAATRFGGVRPPYRGEWRKCPECEVSVRAIDPRCHMCGHEFANAAAPA